jgi:hypothetical protein
MVSELVQRVAAGGAAGDPRRVGRMVGMPLGARGDVGAPQVGR